MSRVIMAPSRLALTIAAILGGRPRARIKARYMKMQSGSRLCQTQKMNGPAAAESALGAGSWRKRSVAPTSRITV